MLAAREGRTLVAMSGGVDSAVAALLSAGDGREAVAVTLELWSDPDNDGDLSCCSAQAVRGARSLAHGLGMPHLSIDLRAEFRAGVVDGWLAGPGRRADSEPVRPLQRQRAPRRDARARRAPRRGDPRHRPLRPRRGGPCCCARRSTAPRTRAMSCARSPPPRSRACASRSESCEKGRVRELAAAAGLAVAGRPDSQDLCFLAGTRGGAFLERHVGLGHRPGPIVHRDGRVLGEHAGAHVYTVGQRHGLGVSAPEPLYVLATDTAANTVTVGPRTALLCEQLNVGELTLAPPRPRGRRGPRPRPRPHAVLPASRGARAPAATSAPRSSWASRPSGRPRARWHACTPASSSPGTPRSPRPQPPPKIHSQHDL